MMTHELEVSILAAPLAAIDRRGLSQAWYNALHLAQRVEQPARSSASNRAVVQPESHRAGADALAPTRCTKCAQCIDNAHDARPRRDIRPPRDTTLHLSQERTLSPLSKRIELRFAANAQPVARATFSLGRGAARVHVIMQSNGSTTRLVAICRPEMRGIVARALAEARLALRARGFAIVEAETKRCS